jgi:hypothetical protein
MHSIDVLNAALVSRMDKKEFMNEYWRCVEIEFTQEFPPESPIDIFVGLTVKDDNLLNLASGLLNIEKPSTYLLMDVLAHYLRYDSRCDFVRQYIDNQI